MHQNSCAVFTYEFLRILKGKGGGHISPSGIKHGNDSNISCKLQLVANACFLTSIGWSFYVPATCVLTLHLCVQRLDYELRIDINWFIDSIAAVIAIAWLWSFAYHILFYWLKCLNSGSGFNLIEVHQSLLRVWIAKDF